ncbi:RNA polymerase subunit sigma-24 [Mangrovactinospora gilvigrisea]|uniref:RNA polymerase subunit sigma-24 n=1 Tax=Mangrovactinospora gilvigrisea TaxID=1428644 RepID=A0A1J7BHA6_9ACTN|nr:DUF6596 domain-containing protein [Mangrovactinospora gilvigrisea]OIV37965.1 RNA polymerase subunit sigma-24 [Mangrovactinospora gilvigrisea]
MDGTDPRRAVEAVWRIESARLIAGLARRVGDLGLAEELAQDALVAALETWPRTGVPERPGAWLMTTAGRRAIDRFRREERFRAKCAELAREFESGLRGDDGTAAFARAEERADGADPYQDDLLRLIFVSCHPVLPRAGRVALTLRLLGGLSTAEIARAFLVPEATVAQRIVRAKRTLARRGVPFAVPREEGELRERLGSVLEVVYLVFNEGYAATAGDDWVRPALCEDAVRLGRVLAGLLPAEGEVLGLLALMELQAARVPARVAASGVAVRLDIQDRSLWDPLLLRRGLEGVERAVAAGGGPGAALGAYTLQAAIAACHVSGETDWDAVAGLYARLAAVAPSPVVELNRAVAVGRSRGAAEGLELVEKLVAGGELEEYHLLWSVRGDLRQRLGLPAADDFSRALTLATNEAERRLLAGRLHAARTHRPPP